MLAPQWCGFFPHSAWIFGGMMNQPTALQGEHRRISQVFYGVSALALLVLAIASITPIGRVPYLLDVSGITMPVMAAAGLVHDCLAGKHIFEFLRNSEA